MMGIGSYAFASEDISCEDYERPGGGPCGECYFGNCSEIEYTNCYIKCWRPGEGMMQVDCFSNRGQEDCHIMPYIE